MSERKVYVATVEGRDYRVVIEEADSACWVTVDDGRAMKADLAAVGGSRYSLLLEQESYEGMLEVAPESLRVWLRGEPFDLQIMDERLKRLAGASRTTSATQSTNFKTPMPGLVAAVTVRVGDEVMKGQPLFTLESMKMRNDLKSGREGKVKEILVETGNTVAKGDVLLRFEG